MKFIRLIGLITFTAVLTACHPFGTSNLEAPSPLPVYTPTTHVTQLWSTSVGDGTNELGLRFAMGYDQGVIYTTDAEGEVTATKALTGNEIWQTDVDTNITAGVGVGSGIVVVGSNDGQVIALNNKTGVKLWSVNVGNQMLAVPQVKSGVVIVKTVADNLIALDATSGRQLWNFVVEAPTLILRFGSTPQIAGEIVYAGFANGKLVALGLQMGNLTWQQQIAMPQGVNAVQQMIDIDADPVLRSDRVYVATYQGNIAAVNVKNGNSIWSHKISTYTGLVADTSGLYVTDAEGHVWSFAAANGAVNWVQKQLQARILGIPALMGNYIVVGDAEGYLHWINKQSGQFAAYVEVEDEDPIAAKPLVIGNNVYVLTNEGELAAYQLSSMNSSGQ